MTLDTQSTPWTSELKRRVRQSRCWQRKRGWRKRRKAWAGYFTVWGRGRSERKKTALGKVK